MTGGSNVVLVTIDSIRADHCTAMEDGGETMPTLDAMAADGATFTSAIAPGPSTPESMPAIFTGRYPPTSVDPTDVDQARSRIRRHMTTRETIAERLSRRGYATAGFTPNPYTSEYFGFDAGFDHFEDFSDSGVRSAGDGLLQRLSPNSDAAQAARMAVNLARREEVFKPWEAYADAVSTWMSEADAPYFAWVHMMDPHVPYMPPSDYRRLTWWQTVRANVAFWRGDNEAGLAPDVLERLRTAYVDTLRYADAFLEHLQSVVDENTVIVVHGDHGEAFGEHGAYGHEPYLYEENVHVPLVVSGVPSTAVAEPVSLRALPELLARVADSDWNPNAVAGEFATSRTADGERVALRGRQVKYIRSARGAELYDLARNEQDQLSAQELEIICEERLAQCEADLEEARTVRDAAERVSEVTA